MRPGNEGKCDDGNRVAGIADGRGHVRPAGAVACGAQRPGKVESRGRPWRRPFVLALIVLIELAGRGGIWLHGVSILFVLGRVLHGIGMDADNAGLPRQIGTGVTMLTLLGLSVFAALAGFGIA